MDQKIELKKLREKLMDGKISEETYKELKTEILGETSVNEEAPRSPSKNFPTALKVLLATGGIFVLVIIVIVILGVILLSFNQSSPTGLVTEIGATSTTINSQQQSPDSPKLSLKYDGGKDVTPEKIFLDGQEKQANNIIDISNLTKGNHSLIIIVNGVEFEKDFYFEGDGITIQVTKPIQTFISVFSKNTNEPIENANIYLDGENKCTTKSDGTCFFFAKPDNYTFRIQGEGIFLEEIKNISNALSSFTFKIERRVPISISVYDEITNAPLEGVNIFLDGSPKGKTDSTGKINVSTLEEGDYVLEAKAENASNSKTIQVSLQNKDFQIKLKVPKAITLTIIDQKTQFPVNGFYVELRNESTGETIKSLFPSGDDGKVKLKNILPGTYRLEVDVPTDLYKTEYKPIQQINVSGTETNLKIEVEMPHPKFIGSLALTVVSAIECAPVREKDL